jgi:hypothetical protein
MEDATVFSGLVRLFMVGIVMLSVFFIILTVSGYPATSLQVSPHVDIPTITTGELGWLEAVAGVLQWTAYVLVATGIIWYHPTIKRWYGRSATWTFVAGVALVCAVICLIETYSAVNSVYALHVFARLFGGLLNAVIACYALSAMSNDCRGIECRSRRAEALEHRVTTLLNRDVQCGTGGLLISSKP